MKKSLFTMVMALMAIFTATAQSIKVEEVTVTRGYDADLVVKYDFPTPYYGFQIDLVLPTGITIENCTLGNAITGAGYQLTWRKLSSGIYRFISYNSQFQSMPTGNGELMRIHFNTNAEMPMATYLSFIESCELTNEQGRATVIEEIDFAINVQIEIEDEDDLQEYLDWLAERESKLNQNVSPQAPEEEYDDLQVYLDLLADISLTRTVEQPDHTDLTINGGSFIPSPYWTEGAVFSIPETGTLTLQNNTIDCYADVPLMMPGKARAKNGAQQLTLFNVNGTLHLAEGTKVNGITSYPTAISMAPDAMVYLEGATLKDMTLNLNEDINVYSSKPIAEKLDVNVPEGCLREGFRMMEPIDGYSFTFQDALSVNVANSEDFCAEVDKDGYLSLFPLSKLGDVNGDGEVSVTDVSLVVKYLLGENVPGMRLAAANAARDGEISVSDVQAIVRIILMY